jgi:hypothetical protein
MAQHLEEFGERKTQKPWQWSQDLITSLLEATAEDGIRRCTIWHLDSHSRGYVTTFHTTMSCEDSVTLPYTTLRSK